MIQVATAIKMGRVKKTLEEKIQGVGERLMGTIRLKKDMYLADWRNSILSLKLKCYFAKRRSIIYSHRITPVGKHQLVDTDTS